VEQLHIRLFGRLEVVYGGSRRPFTPPPRARPLLGYLVLHAGEALGRSSLAALFWPDEPDEDARANLRRHLHQIVRALPTPEGAPWIEASGGIICWPARPDVWVDVHEFERLAGDPATHEAALELYRADLLADCFEDCLIAERERIRAQFLGMCYELALTLRRDREFDRALVFVERILASDDWREDAVRLAMSIRYEAGDRTGALAEYARFATLLHDEMNVTPMPETVALRDAMLANEPLARSGPAHAERGGAEFKTPFVGRSAELETLNAAWARAARGTGTTIFLSGEGGVGKSRLVGELAASVAAEGGRALFGGTSNPEAFPYEALVDALHRSLPVLVEGRIDRRALSHVAQLLPELHAAVADLPVASTLDPAEARTALFEAIARTIEQLARTRPVVLVVEDLHWANAGTIDALEVLARRAGALPVLIVATYRSDEVGPGHALAALRRRLQSERRASSIALRALAAPEIGELVRRTVTGDDPPDRLAASIYTFSEGNPLFATQLLRNYSESGEVPDEGAAVRTIAEAVLARIGALDERTRALAETGAVVGRSFTTDLAMRVLGWREDEIVDALAPLLDRAIVREAGSAAFAYTFTHALIAAAIYDATPPDRRMARHRRIAQVMTEQREADSSVLAAIARHWREAGDVGRAAPAYLRAAQRAAEVYAYDESIDYATQATTLSADAAVTGAALLLRESNHAIRGLRDEQRRDFFALERLLESNGDEALAWELLRRRVSLARGTDDISAEAASLAELKERAVASKRPDWIAATAKAYADHYFATNDYARADASAQEALAAFERLGDERGAIDSLCVLSRIEADHGDTAKTRAYLERVRARLGKHDITTILNATFAAGYAANHRQEFALTVELALEGLELARAGGNKTREGDALNLIGLAATRLGDFSQARRVLGEARELFAATGRQFGVSAATLNLGILDWRLGALDSAYANLTSASAGFRGVKNVVGEILAANNLANVCTRMERHAEAIAHAQNALNLSRDNKQLVFENGALFALGFAKRRAGDPAAGIVHTEQALPLSRSAERNVDILEALAELGLAYAASGQSKKALAVIDELLASPNADIERAFWPHWYWWAAAQVYHHCGQEKKAGAALAGAIARASDFEEKIRASGEDAAPFGAMPMNVAIRASAQGNWPEALA
jgi:DNA-binding SARP family transcriptional activator